MTTEMILAPRETDDDKLRAALIRALGLQKAEPEILELTFAIATRYGLDPMLRHIVIIEGRPFVTRDGLLDIAHRSGQFDGISVSEPWIDGSYIRAKATVWRKDMSHPFEYVGRYPKQGGNARYNEEMAIKVGESMALRRAFRVSAPVVEERWDAPDAGVTDDEPTVTQTLAEKVAARKAQIESVGSQPVGIVLPADQTPVFSGETATVETPLTYTVEGTVLLNPEEVAEGAEPMLADLAPDPAPLPLCEWKLERKGGERIDCLNLAGHDGEHSWAALALQGGGKVIRPEG